MDVAKIFEQHAEESCRIKRRAAAECGQAMAAAVDLVVESLKNGGKTMVCGNGGSAADSQHLATELMSRLSGDFARPAIAAVALTTDTSFLTAHANDYSFDEVFARQVEGLGRPGDVLFGLSTSGNSGNVIRAFEVAKDKGVRTVGLLGGSGGRLRDMADIAIVVPSSVTMHVQETHITMIHVLAYAIERLAHPQSANL